MTANSTTAAETTAGETSEAVADGQEPIGQEPIGQEPIGQEPIDQEPADQPGAQAPAEPDHEPADMVKTTIGTEVAPISAGEHLHDQLERARRVFLPPDLWANPRPTLQQSWLWAAHGQHLPADLRGPARVSTALLLPVRTFLLYVDWIVERPSRALAAALLILAAIQVIQPII